MKRVFIGWDRREVLPWHVLCHSIISRSSVPVSISAVKLSHLPLTRPSEGSTEFSVSRFMVPWMCDYEGLAMFIDCDMLVQCDIREVFDLYDGSDVQVVKHDYTPREKIKFYGNAQVPYPRKNWSSVMLMNAAQCTSLTPDYVDSATAMELHRFAWTDRIGDLPAHFNHLVGEYEANDDAKIIHWTNGGPWLRKYARSDYAHDWLTERIRTEHFLDE